MKQESPPSKRSVRWRSSIMIYLEYDGVLCLNCFKKRGDFYESTISQVFEIWNF